MDAMAQRTPASAVQFFELRTPEEQVIRHVGARLIP
jgi:hypothetical protein